MNAQPEQLLENELVVQLQALGYTRIVIRDETDLLYNLKVQLEKHNKVQLTDAEFNQIALYINKGNNFERSRILR